MLRLAGTIFLLSTSSAATQTIDKFSAHFVDQMGKECRTAQRSNPQNQKMGDNQIAQYCGCVARHTIETVTMDEVFELQRTGRRPHSMQSKLNALGETCAEILLGKVRDGPIR